jgi:hypothetical protein
MSPLATIYEHYQRLFANDHDTAAVRGNEEQPAPTFSRAAPRFP